MTEVWEFRPEWLAYVQNTWSGTGRVELVSDDSPDRLAFYDRAWKSFDGLGFPIKQLKTYISIHQPETGEGYAEHYPHVHYPLDGMTLVHYLTESTIPIEFEEDKYYPIPGLTVIFKNSQEHGVRKNKTTKPRIQMIATALRR